MSAHASVQDQYSSGAAVLQRMLIVSVSTQNHDRRLAFLDLCTPTKLGEKWQNKRRDPVFYLVNAVNVDDKWTLPFLVETLRMWAWLRCGRC